MGCTPAVRSPVALTGGRVYVLGVARGAMRSM